MKILLSRTRFYWLLCWTAGLFVQSAAAQHCEFDNDYLQAMPESQITVKNSANEMLSFHVRTALNNQTRAAGFQRVCAETIADKPILFIFDRPSIPQFHMRNVVAPIDIAFIDSQGRVESIQAMFPYVIGSTIRPLYSPKQEVIAALEVTPGFYQENKIEVGSLIDWSLTEQNTSNQTAQ